MTNSPADPVKGEQGRVKTMSRSKLTKKLNKLLWAGDLEEIRKLIRQYPRLTKACLPFLASDTYRKTMMALLAEKR